MSNNQSQAYQALQNRFRGGFPVDSRFIGVLPSLREQQQLRYQSGRPGLRAIFNPESQSNSNTSSQASSKTLSSAVRTDILASTQDHSVSSTSSDTSDRSSSGSSRTFSYGTTPSEYSSGTGSTSSGFRSIRSSSENTSGTHSYTPTNSFWRDLEPGWFTDPSSSGSRADYFGGYSDISPTPPSSRSSSRRSSTLSDISSIPDDETASLRSDASLTSSQARAIKYNTPARLGNQAIRNAFQRPIENPWNIPVKTTNLTDTFGPSVAPIRYPSTTVPSVSSESSFSNSSVRQAPVGSKPSTSSKSLSSLASKGAATAGIGIGAAGKLAANYYTRKTQLEGERKVLDTRQPTGDQASFRTLRDQRDLDTIQAEKEANEANLKANKTATVGEAIADAVGLGVSVLPAFL
jgi:hypothetical protein